MTREELLNFLEWFAGDEMPNEQRMQEHEKIVDLYLTELEQKEPCEKCHKNGKIAQTPYCERCALELNGW